MESLLQDLRVAARGWRRSRSVAIAVIATLALAVGAGVTTFTLAHAALISPPPFPDADRLALVYTTRVEPGHGPERLRWSYPRFRMLERSLRTVAAVGSYGLSSVNLSTGAGGDALVAAEPARGEPVAGEYFAALGARPLRGRLFTAEEDRSPGAAPVVVIGHDLWTLRFAEDPGAIGGILRVNGTALTIVGIMPRDFRGLTGRAELWFPAVQAPSLTYPEYLTTNQDFISVVARVRPEASIASLAAETATVGAAIQRALPSDPDTPGDRFGATAVALDDVRVNANTRRAVLVLLGAGVVVLLLACANVSSLLIANAASRRREMAVRMAVGASRRRLARQLLTETALLVSLGGALGIPVAWVATRLVAPGEGAIGPGNFYGAVGEFIRPHVDPLLALSTAAIIAVTALLCGLAPALTAIRGGLSTSMRLGGSVTRTGAAGALSLRSIAVAVEIALAVVLLVGGSLMLATLARLRGESLGIDPTHVVTFVVRPPEVRYPVEDAPAFIERLLGRIERIPGVVAATVDGCAPLVASCANTTLHFVGRPEPRPGEAPPIRRHYVGAGHFTTLGIPVVRGRVFSVTDREGRPAAAVVNEAAAKKFWPGDDPIGARIWFGGGSAWNSPDSSVEVVGIVGDVPYQEGEERRVQPAVYTSYLQFTYSTRTVMVRTSGDPAATIPAIRTAVRDVDPDLALYDLGVLTRQLGDAWARKRFTTGVLTAFAALALVLAATGVFAVVANAVADRTREIGIRLALGADAGDVARLIVRQGMALPVAGLVVGAALAFPAAGALRGLLYGVSATDPVVFVAVIVGLAVVALLATAIPARRATRVDPRVAMLAE